MFRFYLNTLFLFFLTFQGKDQAPDLNHTKNKVKLYSLKLQYIKGWQRMTLQRHKSWAIRRTLLEYEEGSLEKTALYKSFSANFPFTFFHFPSLF